MNTLNKNSHLEGTAMENNSTFTQLEDEIRQHASLHEQDKIDMLKNIQLMANKKVNILITGPTGVGKSSTINALFGTSVATVGVGVDPETMEIAKYTLGALTIWDSPGFGDSVEKDEQHADKIRTLLRKNDSDGNALIDMVLHLVDGSQKDLGTSIVQLTNVIIPTLGDGRKDRILVAINQADQAKKGRGWDSVSNQPTDSLLSFLDEKVNSIESRIKVSTGIEIKPIYYSAGYKDEDEQQAPYNLSKLLYFIIQHTPAEKVPSIVIQTNPDATVWGERPEDKEYKGKIRTSMVAGIMTGASAGAKMGAKIGSSFGPVGTSIGTAVGALIGGVFGGIFG